MNNQKYQDLFRVLFVNFIALIVVTICLVDFSRGDLKSFQGLTIIFSIFILLAAIVEYSIIKFLKNKGIFKTNRFLLLMIF